MTVMQGKQVNPTGRIACHKLVAETAQEMARHLYELNAINNEFFARWPKRRAFVNVMWPSLIDQARATLAAMLQSELGDSLKKDIHEALLLDHSLRAMTGHAAQAHIEPPR